VCHLRKGCDSKKDHCGGDERDRPGPVGIVMWFVSSTLRLV